MTDKLIKSVEDLDVFQRAYRASLDLHRISLVFPKLEQFVLADQVRRASKSICANMAEGFSKQRMSSKEFKRFLGMAIASADEMQIWINYCKDLDYMSADTAVRYKSEYKEIAKMLSGLMKRWS